MFRVVIILFISCFSVSVFGQNVELAYLDQTMSLVSNNDFAEYYREVSTSESGLYMVEVYYHPSGKLKMTGSYSDEELTVEEGQFTYYHRNGEVESRGMYSEGVKYGIWERFRYDGTQKSNKFYSGATVDELLNTRYRSKTANFPGGEDMLYSYLEENIRYPEAAAKQGLEGEVIISFVVTEHGEIQNPTITQSAHYYLDKEAERLVANMPYWEPAMKGGYNIQSNFVLPIVFKLPE